MNRFLGDESVSLPDTICMYMLNCCSLFFFFSVFAQGYIVFFSASTARICDLGFFDLDSFSFSFSGFYFFFVGLRVRKQL